MNRYCCLVLKALIIFITHVAWSQAIDHRETVVSVEVTWRDFISHSESNLSWRTFQIHDQSFSHRPPPTSFQIPLAFTSSNLPIMVVTTESRMAIPDEPKIKAHLGIIYNGEEKRNHLSDAFNEYDGMIGIERRGNVTQSFPKKPYNFETRDEAGNNRNVSLLGMPEENDWVLRAVYIDKTLMRNSIAHRMSRLMGNYSSRTAFCELVLNGQYEGVYILMEKIKPDKNRVNIAKMDATDISGEAVTGGYIYEVAQGGADFGKRRRFKYPKATDIEPEQAAYIRQYDDGFRIMMARDNFADPISGYPAWIDVDSFIDEILVQEACKNSDAYGWSSFFHKDRLGKLRAGPVWDFDQALSNSTFSEGPRTDEWQIEKGYADHPFFWKKLFHELEFKHRLSHRWFELRKTVFHTDSLLEYIDQTAIYLNEAQQRNFKRWPILGVELWRSTPGWAERDTYQKEVDYLRHWFVRHLAWIDAQLAPFDTSLKNSSTNQGLLPINFQLYPNPCAAKTTFHYQLTAPATVQVTIYNLLGRVIFTFPNQNQPAGEYHLTWNGLDQHGQSVASGFYLVNIRVNNRPRQSLKLVKYE